MTITKLQTVKGTLIVPENLLKEVCEYWEVNPNSARIYDTSPSSSPAAILVEFPGIGVRELNAIPYSRKEQFSNWRGDCYFIRDTNLTNRGWEKDSVEWDEYGDRSFSGAVHIQ